MAVQLMLQTVDVHWQRPWIARQEILSSLCHYVSIVSMRNDGVGFTKLS